MPARVPVRGGVLLHGSVSVRICGRGRVCERALGRTLTRTTGVRRYANWDSASLTAPWNVG